MRRPRPLRRVLATRKPRTMTAARTTKPRIGLGTSPSRPRNEARVPRAMPRKSSSGPGEPGAPPPPAAGGAPPPPPPGGVGEADLLEGDARRERHHRQAHAPHAQRRSAGHEPEHSR